jgi:Leucine-rich repeat (LRR) protein
MKAPREDLKVGDIIDGKSLVELHTDNDKNLSMKVADFSGIAAIATAIKGGTKITMLDLSDNNLHAQGGRLLAEALAGSQITELNMSTNRLNRLRLGYPDTDSSGVVALCNGPLSSGPLAKLNLGSNNIGERVYPQGWRAGDTVWKFRHSDGRTQDRHPGEELVQGRPESAIALAAAIKGSKSLLSLNLADNSIGSRPEGVRALTAAIGSNGTLVSININENNIAMHVVARLYLKVWIASLSVQTAFVIGAAVMAVVAWAAGARR